MVFKATAYGRFGHSIEKGPGKATPLEYLRRIAASNEAFNDSSTIVGKFENENVSLGLIYAQEFIEQSPAGALHATPEQPIHFQSSSGSSHPKAIFQNSRSGQMPIWLSR